MHPQQITRPMSLRPYFGIALGLIAWALLSGCPKKFNDPGQMLGSGFTRPHSAGIVSVLWRRHIDPNYRNKVLTWKLSPEELAAPDYDSGLGQVCVGSERQFFSCFDQHTGKLKWVVKTQGRVASTAIIHGDLFLVGTTSGIMYAFNRSNGKPGWKKPYQSDGEILSTPTLVKRKKKAPLVVFTASNNKVFGLNAQTGTWVWLYRRDPPARLSIRGQGAPLYHKGVIYAGFSDGSVAAIDALTGSEKWVKIIRENDRFPDVDADLVIDEGLLFASSYSGSLHALKIKDGKKVWKRRISGATRPVVSDGNLFVATSDGRIAKFNASNGKPLWKKPRKFKKAGSFQALVANDYYLFASSSRRGLYVIGREKGRQIQVLRFGSGFAPPILAGERLFILSYSSFLYALTTKKSVNAQR